MNSAFNRDAARADRISGFGDFRLLLPAPGRNGAEAIRAGVRNAVARIGAVVLEIANEFGHRGRWTNDDGRHAPRRYRR